MHRETELELVRSLKRGDEAAFERIYETHRAKVFSFLLRLTRDRHNAEELLEETWLRLVTRAHTLADDSRLLPWLLTVARNLYLSQRRSHQLHNTRLDEFAQTMPTSASSGSPFEHAAGHELEARIEQALATLSIQQREVLLLIAIEGLTPTEAASVCGISPEAMRQRLSRARSNLARKLEESGVELRKITSPPAPTKTRMAYDA